MVNPYPGRLRQSAENITWAPAVTWRGTAAM